MGVFLVTQLPDLYTPDDVAAKLGKTADYWLRQARAGKIPHRRIGASIRFTASDVTAYVESKKVDPLLSVVGRR